MEKITDILLAEVIDEDDRSYGRVFELRSDGDPEHGKTSKARKINTLLCGSYGILQEIGFKPSNVSAIQWDEVIDIKRGKITIRPPGKES